MYNKGDTVYFSRWDEIAEHLGVVNSVTENGYEVKLTDGLEAEYVTAQEFELKPYNEGATYCD